jgi:DNA-directed RNA polymerase subunit RPC12/RpoP
MAMGNRCGSCGETIEAGYAICWKCGTGLDGTPPANDFVPDTGTSEAAQRSLACLRCRTRMVFARHMKLHEGSLLPGVLLDVGKLFTNREGFDAYACPGCGKVEFFLAQ